MSVDSIELAHEQGFAFLTEIFRELCPEGYDPEVLYRAFVEGARDALTQWRKADTRGEPT
ncbi:MAG: hypothetical protein QME75_10595 [Deltaproteobacteria bacterium]|nr:hypothetical protein [Deltaproteobacteria bacterium]